MTDRPWALVALNMGGPDRLDAVEPFLVNVLSDPDLVRLPFPMSALRLRRRAGSRRAQRRRPRRPGLDAA